MEIAGYIASILIGISLGLIGGGGSILTVPVLVYLFHLDAVLATTYSLFIVGSTSFVGSLTYFKKGLVKFKTAIIFGVPSIITVFLTRTFIVHSIPHIILQIGDFVITKSIFIMVLFAVLMLAASISMIKKSSKPLELEDENQKFNFPLIIAEGAAVGILTGLVGAGGGFLIIPALINFLKLPMKKAIGTSLVIISMNSLIGFLFSLFHTSVDWSFLFTIAIIATVGIFIGSYLSTKIDGNKLKPAFGWFVLIMGIYILIKEFFFQ
jgi:uncharacterized membrane protein YfcA